MGNKCQEKWCPGFGKDLILENGQWVCPNAKKWKTYTDRCGKVIKVLE